jgi:phenylpyruvate tautomerase PptA (4-oxalocrotonate tautomerase family)
MPLVRIDVVEGRRTPDELRRLADTVQEVMLDVFAAPPGDRYQVITEHHPGQLICEDTGLGIERTDDLVILQVFQQGRSEARSGRSTPGWRDGWRRPPACDPATSSSPSPRTPARTGPSAWGAPSSSRATSEGGPQGGEATSPNARRM